MHTRREHILQIWHTLFCEIGDEEKGDSRQWDKLIHRQTYTNENRPYLTRYDTNIWYKR